MSLVVWTTTALVIWLVLWALGAKAFDAAMLAVVIILIGATIEALKKYIPGRSSSG
jgi:VanZ family protein